MRKAKQITEYVPGTKVPYLYVTAYNQSKPIRLKLNREAAIQINNPCWSTGIECEQVWFGRNRIVVEYYSIWQGNNGGVVGQYYDVLEHESDILAFCDKARINPPSWVSVEEI